MAASSIFSSDPFRSGKPRFFCARRIGIGRLLAVVSRPRHNPAQRLIQINLFRGMAGDAVCMPLFMYRCPNTGYRVQGFSAEDISEDQKTYESVTCPVCRQLHLVNPATGRVLGEASVADAAEKQPRGKQDP